MRNDFNRAQTEPGAVQNIKTTSHHVLIAIRGELQMPSRVRQLWKKNNHDAFD